ncbi:MAG: FadR/GntR family transcriptional regulator [Rhizobiaceae bacterium]
MTEAAEKPKKKPRKESVHEKIVETLGRKIVSGAYSPGHLLGNETTTGGSFNASRTATREALKILSSKGLIVSRPKVGTIVRKRSEWSLLDPQILEWCLQDPMQSSQTMAEIYEIRTAFEPYAASLAAENRSKEDQQNIRRALRGMTYYVDSADKAECDLAFHKAILLATGNSLFLAVGELISVALRHLFRAGFEATSEEDERWLLRHRSVADAIDRGDSKLSQEMMRKLLSEAQETQTARRSLPPT